MTGRLLDLLAETRDIQKLLEGVAELAVETVPGCDAASVTVIRNGRSATVAGSDERALAVDEIQYSAGLGPCLQAARTDQVVQVDDVRQVPAAVEEGLPAWSQVAPEAGFTATLSVPIAAGAQFAAALNIYNAQGIGWFMNSLDAAEHLATYAGSALIVASR